MSVMINDCHEKERLKAYCQTRLGFHKKNVALQAVISFLCIVGGLYAAEKKSALVPLVLAPSAAVSLSKLDYHNSKRRFYKKYLEDSAQKSF